MQAIIEDVKDKLKAKAKRAIDMHEVQTFKLGDHVRVSMGALYAEFRKEEKKGLRKNLAIKYSPEIFVVVMVIPPKPENKEIARPQYELKRLTTGRNVKRQVMPNEIKGTPQGMNRFFGTEMQLVDLKAEAEYKDEYGGNAVVNNQEGIFLNYMTKTKDLNKNDLANIEEYKRRLKAFKLAEKMARIERNRPLEGEGDVGQYEDEDKEKAKEMLEEEEDEDDDLDDEWADVDANGNRIKRPKRVAEARPVQSTRSGRRSQRALHADEEEEEVARRSARARAAGRGAAGGGGRGGAGGGMASIQEEEKEEEKSSSSESESEEEDQPDSGAGGGGPSLRRSSRQGTMTPAEEERQRELAERERRRQQRSAQRPKTTKKVTKKTKKTTKSTKKLLDQ